MRDPFPRMHNLHIYVNRKTVLKDSFRVLLEMTHLQPVNYNVKFEGKYTAHIPHIYSRYTANIPQIHIAHIPHIYHTYTADIPQIHTTDITHIYRTCTANIPYTHI